MTPPTGATTLDAEIRLHQKTIAARPENTEALVLLGRAWIRKARDSSDPGYYLHAKGCAELVLAINPDDRVAINILAQVALNDHRMSDARQLAKRVLSKDPDNIEALGALSDAELELGNYPEAVKAAEKQVDLKPFLPSYARASYLSWLHGDDKQALESIRLAIESGNNPEDPEPRAWAMTQAALYFFHKGDYTGADAGFVRALSQRPDYPPALVGRGRAAMARGDARGATEFFRRAHDATPLVETAWRLGDARSASGDAKGAEKAYEQVIRDGRKHDPRTLARFFAVKNRDIPQALRLAEEEMKRRPGVYTLDVYAWVLYRSGKLTEAKKYSSQALSLGTKDAELMFHAGAIRMANGETEGGKKLVREALALSPEFDPTGSAEARKLLDAPKKP